MESHVIEWSKGRELHPHRNHRIWKLIYLYLYTKLLRKDLCLLWWLNDFLYHYSHGIAMFEQCVFKIVRRVLIPYFYRVVETSTLKSALLVLFSQCTISSYSFFPINQMPTPLLLPTKCNVGECWRWCDGFLIPNKLMATHKISLPSESIEQGRDTFDKGFHLTPFRYAVF